MENNWQKLFQKYTGILQNYPLKSVTTLKIGGPGKGFIEVKSETDLQEIIKDCLESDIPYLSIGGGSNLLVSDQGFKGLVIKISLTGLTENDGVITALAGTPLQELVDYTINKGLGGMSTMIGIPGSVGGAIYGSAGAYGDNIRDHLSEINFFDGVEVKSLTRGEFETGYRDSFFKTHKNFVIVSAKFSGFPKEVSEDLKAEAEEILEKRKEKYPPETKCPGSFFRNIPFDQLDEGQIEHVRKVFNEAGKDAERLLRFKKVPAGVLLELAGANGDQLGQIKVAENHGNTFFNLGEGTAEDFFNLAKKWKGKVKEKFDVDLTPEVQLIGFSEAL